MQPLISVQELARRLGGPDLVVVDCRFNLLAPAAGRQLWRESHIPGAYYADLNEDLAGPVTASSGRHPLPAADRLGRLFGSWGLAPEHDLVVYDADGGAIAARLWWLAKWAGHARVAILDGGYPAWLEAGQPVAATPPELVRATYPVQAGQMPVVSTADVEAALAGISNLEVVDARAAPRFAGTAEPIDSVAGHIPGARNRPFSTNLSDTGHFKLPEELAAELAALPVNSSLVAMCGSGVTACHTLFALELAGLVDADSPPALYVGSWSEWIREPNRPVATDA